MGTYVSDSLSSEDKKNLNAIKNLAQSLFGVSLKEARQLVDAFENDFLAVSGVSFNKRFTEVFKKIAIGTKLVPHGFEDKFSFDKNKKITKILPTMPEWVKNRNLTHTFRMFASKALGGRKGLAEFYGRSLEGIDEPDWMDYGHVDEASPTERAEQVFDRTVKHDFKGKPKSARESASVLLADDFVPYGESMSFKEREDYQDAIGAELEERDRHKRVMSHLHWKNKREDIINRRKEAAQDEALRKMLLKKLPRFFKDSKISTEQLKKTAEGFKAIHNIPFLGKFIGKNPITDGAAIAGSVIGIIKGVSNTVASANEQAVGWSNMKNFVGSVDPRFQKAAYLAGMKDPNQIAKAYGDIVSRYGGMEAFISLAGTLGGMKGGLQKVKVMEALGFDPSMAALLDIYSGRGGGLVDEVRRKNAKRNMVRVNKTLGIRSGTGVWEKLGSLITDPEYSSMYDETEAFGEFVGGARRAAESLKAYEASGKTTMYERSSTTLNINGNIIANDPQELLEGIRERVAANDVTVFENFDSANGRKFA